MKIPLTPVGLSVAAALLGPDALEKAIMRNTPFRLGVTSAQPDDPERKRKADLRRERRQSKRPHARIYV